MTSFMTITPPSSSEFKTEPSPSTSNVDSTLINTLLHSIIKIIRGTLAAAVHESLSNTDLKFFIQEILKRSRASKTSIIITCYYLTNLAKCSADVSLPSIKRLFLGCLILSFKFSRDFNFSFKTWSLMSGLEVHDLQTIERAILGGLNYDLYVNGASYTKFETVVNTWLATAAPSELVSEQDAAALEQLTSFKKVSARAVSEAVFTPTSLPPMTPKRNVAYKATTISLPKTPTSIELDSQHGKKRRFSDCSADDEGIHAAFIDALSKRQSLIAV
ncbi:hypothetical protein BABINDRAFT_162640 [Babjeviella inositovora NRRL Y-12698]|uniref:Cyclin N-terminal domain-containing protein n=1 Tax=Babjeviella inositovora NRRL Y-12698 TaxID=984486 RepID=A0A1E3QL28_9ASCO|nr:uncharacterized protein BABINDRAFT_162640 [Babjeviella inositovora NRRL Y-12698]ODQ78409.1 hypothetical protein BABINDRAFT_162640 [Babjeviella inositovora NRRL Y-12698]